MRLTAVCVLALSAALGRAAAAQPAEPKPSAVAPSVWLIPGGVKPDREPDGNTVVFVGRKGLVVVDTGRHAWHTQAILDFAAARRAPILAVVNSHWHLDHTSGNAPLRRAYPGLKVYASDAIEEALTGFLARGAAESKDYLAKGHPPETLAEDIRQDLATTAAAAQLRPDVVVRRSAMIRLGGRNLDVRQANGATRGDVWLFDPKAKVAAVGDLVTLPTPFLDTACPRGWLAALGEIEATPFQVLVPGHGPAMTRTEFAAWRGAFSALLDCAATAAAKADCAQAWAAAVDPFIAPADSFNRRRAQIWTEGYVELLRSPAPGLSANCR